jgi:hypothetical protein
MMLSTRMSQSLLEEQFLPVFSLRYPVILHWNGFWKNNFYQFFLELTDVLGGSNPLFRGGSGDQSSSTGDQSSSLNEQCLAVPSNYRHSFYANLHSNDPNLLYNPRQRLSPIWNGPGSWLPKSDKTPAHKLVRRRVSTSGADSDSSDETDDSLSDASLAAAEGKLERVTVLGDSESVPKRLTSSSLYLAGVAVEPLAEGGYEADFNNDNSNSLDSAKSELNSELNNDVAISRSDHGREAHDDGHDDERSLLAAIPLSEVAAKETPSMNEHRRRQLERQLERDSREAEK